MLPAAGQGSLAIECRSADAPRKAGSTEGSQGVLAQALAALDDPDTRLAVTAERALLARLEAGCAAPVGAYAYRKGSLLYLEAVVCAVDGTARSGTRRPPTDSPRSGPPCSGLSSPKSCWPAAPPTSRTWPLPEPRNPSVHGTAQRPQRQDRRRANGHGIRVPGGRPRPRRRAARTVRRTSSRPCAAPGAEPLLLPLIDFELASDQHSLDVAFDALGAGAYTWLVVSSVTTVQALEAKAAERGTTLSGWLPGSLLVATIGPATRRFLESRGVGVDLAPTGQQSGAGAHRHLARAPGQRAPAAGRHRRPPAPPRARGPGRLRPGRHRVPHRGLPGRPGPQPRRVPARHAAWGQCGGDSPHGQNRGRRAHPGPGESRNRRRPAGRRRRRFPQRSPAHPRGPRPAGRLPLRRDRTVHRRRGESLGLSVAAIAEEPTASGLVAAVVRAWPASRPHRRQPVAEPPAKDTI